MERVKTMPRNVAADAESYRPELLGEEEPRYLRRQKPLEIRRKKFSGRSWPFYRRALGMVEEKPALRTDEISFGLSHFPPMLRKMKRKNEARELDAQIKSILPK